MFKGFGIPIINKQPDVFDQIKKLREIQRSIESVFCGKVSPIPGSIVLCDLLAGEYHSGVYVGNKKIVHLEGNGSIRAVSPEVFLARLAGLTAAKTILVSCSRDGDPLGDVDVAQRALDKIGESRDYNLAFDNCHQFSSGCLTGNFENSDNWTGMLKMTARKHLGAEKWLVWDDYDGGNHTIVKLLSEPYIIR